MGIKETRDGWENEFKKDGNEKNLNKKEKNDKCVRKWKNK
jgi:hypothetical protein